LEEAMPTFNEALHQLKELTDAYGQKAANAEKQAKSKDTQIGSNPELLNAEWNMMSGVASRLGKVWEAFEAAIEDDLPDGPETAPQPAQTTVDDEMLEKLLTAIEERFRSIEGAVTNLGQIVHRLQQANPASASTPKASGKLTALLDEHRQTRPGTTFGGGIGVDGQ